MTNAAGPPCANSASGGPQNTRVASPFSSYSAQDSARQAMAEELGTAAGSAGTASSSGGRVAVAETSHDAQLARQVHEDEVVALMQTHSDRELARQLSTRQSMHEKLVAAPSVRHTPRVNSVALLPPDDDDAAADRGRLLLRLQMYSLVEKHIAGDGNCQFRALCDQFCGTPDYHAELRAAVVRHLRSRADTFAPYVPRVFDAYCDEMARDGTWGDHVTLQAAADLLGTHINVITSFADGAVLSISPHAPAAAASSSSSPPPSASQQQQQQQQQEQQQAVPAPNGDADGRPVNTATSKLNEGAGGSSGSRIPVSRAAACNAGGNGRGSPKEQTLYLSFWAEVHYNSLYPADDPPLPPPAKPPKVLGSRTLGKLCRTIGIA